MAAEAGGGLVVGGSLAVGDEHGAEHRVGGRWPRPRCGRRVDGGGPAGLRAGVARRQGRRLRAVPGKRVHVRPRPIGHGGPGLAATPSARPAAQERRLRYRVGGLRRGVAVGPLERGDCGAAPVEESDPERAELDERAPTRVPGPERVAVAALRARAAVPVGLARARLEGPEGLGGRVGRRGAALRERLPLRLGPEAAVLGRAAHAFPRQPFVARAHVVGRRHGDERVPAHGAHRVPDGALLVAGVGVAERESEAVVRRERPERGGGADPLADSPADAAGVVGREPGGHAAGEPGHGLGPPARAFRVPAPGHLRRRHVREGERHHQVARRASDAGHAELALAEAGLGLARRPLGLEEHVDRRPGLGLPLLHVGLHGRVAALVAVFLPEPLVDAGRGAAPLAPAPPVLDGPGVDDGLARVGHGAAPLPGRRPRRHVAHVAALAHGGL